MNDFSDSSASAVLGDETIPSSHVKLAPLVAIVLLSVTLQTSRLLEGTPTP